MPRVDALSRSPDHPPREMELAEFILKIEASGEDCLLTLLLKDEKLRTIIGVLKDAIKDEQAKQMTNDFVLQNQRLYRKTEDGLFYPI